MIEEKLLPALGIEQQHHDAQHSGDGKEEEHGALHTVRGETHSRVPGWRRSRPLRRSAHPG